MGLIPAQVNVLAHGFFGVRRERLALLGEHAHGNLKQFVVGVVGKVNVVSNA